MTRNELIRMVALRMDEVTPDINIDDITVDGADGNPLYALIDGLVDAGALELFSVAPYWRLPQTGFGSDNIALADAGSQRKINDEQTTISARKMIRLKVPDDFLRVAEINCTGFQRPITEAVPEISELGKRQHNPFLMAKDARPVGVMSHGMWTTGSGTSATTEHCREIDCYSLPGNTTVTPTSGIEATYIATPVMPEIDSNDDVEDVVPSVLMDALEWLIAARTFGARGDANHAAICQQNAQNLLV